MIVQKVKRVANPHGSAKRRRPKAKKNAHRRRKLSAKQIKIFGTKAQKAALKRNSHKRRAVSTTKRRAVRVASNPKRKATRRRKRTTTKNPAHLLTLGFVNPSRKRGTKVAKRRTKKAKKNAHSTHRRRVTKSRRSAKNATRIIVMAPKRKNAHRGRRRATRNPQFFGHQIRPMDMAKYVAGGLIGVTVVKAAVPMLPSSLTSNNIMKVASSVAVAFAAGWAASKVSPEFGSSVMFGGLMQAGSVLLNAYIPQASQFALSGVRRGVGDYVPASFPIPQTPVVLSGPVGQGGAAGRPRINRAYPYPY